MFISKYQLITLAMSHGVIAAKKQDTALNRILAALHNGITRLRNTGVFSDTMLLNLLPSTIEFTANGDLVADDAKAALNNASGLLIDIDDGIERLLAMRDAVIIPKGESIENIAKCVVSTYAGYKPKMFQSETVNAICQTTTMEFFRAIGGENCIQGLDILSVTTLSDSLRNELDDTYPLQWFESVPRDSFYEMLECGAVEAMQALGWTHSANTADSYDMIAHYLKEDGGATAGILAYAVWVRWHRKAWACIHRDEIEILAEALMDFALNSSHDEVKQFVHWLLSTDGRSLLDEPTRFKNFKKFHDLAVAYSGYLKALNVGSTNVGKPLKIVNNVLVSA